MTFGRITVLGVGLIGASFAMGMKKKGLCTEIVGFGRSEENLLRAKKRGIIDSYELKPGAACEGSGLVMFSTPVGSFIDLARESSPFFSDGAIVTDAGSVKGNLVYELEKAMPRGVRYIGAHPIAGSDRSGIEYSSAELFHNAKCIITPTPDSDRDALRAVSDIWESLGSGVVSMGPEKHDEIYAFVSHLPHIIAYSLINTVAEADGSYLQFCGPGFRDMTRLASSSHELWRDISLLNAEKLNEAILLFQKNLDRLRGHLTAADAGSLEAEFREARRVREGIGKG